LIPGLTGLFMVWLPLSSAQAFVIQSKAVALDYIGKRGSTQGVTKEKRIEYAKQVRMPVHPPEPVRASRFSMPTTLSTGQ
jgi:hypothetical protein